MDTPIPLIELAGTHREIGRQIGEESRDVIARALARYEVRFPVLAGMTFTAAVEAARPYLRPAEEYLPDAVDELRGIAEGAGVPFEQLLALNCSEETTCAADWVWPPAEGHCTSFAFVAGGRTVAGHNEDWYPDDIDALVVRRTRVRGGAEHISVGPAYYLPITGVTARGFSSAANTVYCRDERVGVPNNVVLAGVLEAGGIDDAAALITGAERARGSNHLFADVTGRILDVETSATRLARMDGGACFAHTNHYVSAQLAPQDASRSEGSPKRLARAYGLLAAGLDAGTDLVDLAMSVLRDHANAPESICGHWNDADPAQDQSVTTVSMVWEPAERRVHVAAGQPCEHEYVTYEL
jgi:isopenicillin-N N-acyltransferase-like protein